jgi:precorrin-3B synthase
VIDGGGALGLDAIAADIRLRAEAMNGVVAFRVGIGGDHATAVELGSIAVETAVDAAARLLEVLARRGPDARARDILATEGVAPFHATLADLAGSARFRDAAPGCGDPELVSRRRRNERSEEFSPSRSAIGRHRLRDGSLACGIGLAFGHADATALERLAAAAAAADASGMRAAPDRTLMVIGVAAASLQALVARAEQLGFVVRADDPRRRVVACAGAPVCASAHVAARALAPVIAEKVAAPGAGAPTIVHISGCAKGCAHAAPAALTVVGTPDGCALIANGSARDIPFAVVAENDLPDIIAAGAREPSEAGHV